MKEGTMSLRCIAAITIISLTAGHATWAQSATDNEGRAHMNSAHQSLHAAGRRTHAEARITVKSSEATPYDQTAGPVLMEMRLSEIFAGDMQGESPVRALQVKSDDHSASLVSMQRFTGKLGGRQGSFVLQGQETVMNGKIKATWFVVPGSGTGDLRGLRGEGGFEGDFGKASIGTLDYWFE
jgi:uncharacterized protein DUF3224